MMKPILFITSVLLTTLILAGGVTRIDVPTDENPREWTIEELGEIIVASGNFWEDWWDTIERFSFEHIGNWAYIHPYSTIYSELLSTSGFENLNDIRDYLLKYYTESWVDAMLSRSFAPFIEYNNVLFIHAARACSVRPDWETATHTLISQDGCYASVESTVLYRSCYPTETDDGLIFMHVFEVTYNFTFINGRIDTTSVCPIWGE